MAKKRYEKNPYTLAAVNGFLSIATDYINAMKTLENDPGNEDAMVAVDFFMEFVDWAYELTGFSKNRMGLMLVEMLEVDPDELMRLQKSREGVA